MLGVITAGTWHLVENESEIGDLQARVEAERQAGMNIRILGLELPIQTRAPQVLLTTPGQHQLGPTLTVVNRALSLKQLPSGEFFIGGGWPTDVVGHGQTLACRVRSESVSGVLAELVGGSQVPELAPVSTPRIGELDQQ